MLARMHQISDVLGHSRQHQARIRHQAILGDLNTSANGLARLSPHYCCDRMRWWTLGWFEAEVWDQCIFKCKGECGTGALHGSSVGCERRRGSESPTTPLHTKPTHTKVASYDHDGPRNRLTDRYGQHSASTRQPFSCSSYSSYSCNEI